MSELREYRNRSVSVTIFGALVTATLVVVGVAATSGWLRWSAFILAVLFCSATFVGLTNVRSKNQQLRLHETGHEHKWQALTKTEMRARRDLIGIAGGFFAVFSLIAMLLIVSHDRSSIYGFGGLACLIVSAVLLGISQVWHRRIHRPPTMPSDYLRKMAANSRR